ncbi:phage gene 29 protein family protein [Rhodococcus erythropolis]|uniref:phage gene 29 protein family protein n=1 Tax=Rhodococcus erythropolis TaxID=1833 RepID=UPI003672C3F2
MVVPKADKDGVIRERRTGIVLARKARHPGADLFRDVPMGDGLPGMHMATEAEHLLAIHFFDNLGYDVVPPNPLYKAAVDPDSRKSTGSDRVVWVPIDTPEVDIEDDGELIVVPDIDGYTDDQIDAMELQVAQIKLNRKLLAQADPHVRGEGEL